MIVETPGQHIPTAFTLSRHDAPSCRRCTEYYEIERAWPCAYTNRDDVLNVSVFAAAATDITALLHHHTSILTRDLPPSYPEWVWTGLHTVSILHYSHGAWSNERTIHGDH